MLREMLEAWPRLHLGVAGEREVRRVRFGLPLPRPSFVGIGETNRSHRSLFASRQARPLTLHHREHDLVQDVYLICDPSNSKIVVRAPEAVLVVSHSWPLRRGRALAGELASAVLPTGADTARTACRHDLPAPQSGIAPSFSRADGWRRPVRTTSTGSWSLRVIILERTKTRAR